MLFNSITIINEKSTLKVMEYLSFFKGMLTFRKQYKTEYQGAHC